MFVFIKPREDDCFLEDIFMHFGPSARIILGASITSLKKNPTYTCKVQNCGYQISAEFSAAYTNKLIYYTCGEICMFVEIAVDLYNLYLSLSFSYIYLYIKLHGYLCLYANTNVCCKAVFCKWEETHPYDVITAS